MRKLKLLLAACALTGASAVCAQTDVTSTYLTNADFSQGTAETTDIYGYGHDGSPWGLQEVEGWTITVVNGDDDVKDGVSHLNSGMGGAVFSYGSENKLRGNQKSAPTTAPDGSSGNCLGFFAVWGLGGYYYQNVTLEAGKYTLTIPIYNQSGTQGNTSYCGFFADGEGGASYTVAVNPTVGSWANQTVTFTLAEQTTGQIRLGYVSTGGGSSANPMIFIDGVKIEYTDLLAGVKADLAEEIQKAKALTVSDADAAALNEAIEAAEAVQSSGTTEQDFIDAISALKNAENLAVNGLTSASATNGINTSLIVNGTFDNNIDGWSRTGTYQNNKLANNQTGAFTGNFYENWNGGAQVNKMYQVVENVPNGTYRLKIAAFVNNLDDPNDSQFVYANDDKVYLTTGEPTAYEVWTVVTTNKIEVGLSQTEAIANWMGIDNVSLSYYGAGDVIEDAKFGAVKPDWEAAKQAAEDALASTDYANVTGDEMSALAEEVEKSEPSSVADYQAATKALTDATSAFKAAKLSYDQLAAANEAINSLSSLPYADNSLYPSTGSASTAAEAAAAAAEIYPAIRAYVESNAVAASVSGAKNYDSAVADANADKNQGWTNGIGTNQGQGYIDAAGTVASKYLDGGWSGSTGANIDMTRQIDVPAGRYLLTVTARGSVSLDEYTLSIAGETIDLPHISNTGGVFGNGWNDASVEFESEGEPLTLEIIAKSTATQQWISLNRFRLVQLEEIAVPMADESDYADLASAISSAEANTLGFESGEYAPYNNLEAVEALLAAKAIDPEAADGNTKKVVQAAIDNLSDASWTENTSDVDIVYNGMYVTETEGANYPEGWKRTNAWGQMQSNISGDFETAYYNQPGSMQYGNQGAYLMPLAANTAYKLTFSYRGHEWGSCNGVTARILNGSTAIKSVVFPAFEPNDSWTTVSTVFFTNDAANYVLSLDNNGNTWMTNVSIVKAEPESVTVTSDGYATFVGDYDLDFTSTDIKAFTAKVDGDKVVLTPINKVAADTPVVLYCEGGNTEEIPFAATTDTPAASDLVAGNGDAVATSDGDYTNYILNNGNGIGFYKANNQTVDKGRAYLHVAATSEARLQIVFDGATAISEVKSIGKSEAVYNLSGQRVNSPKKGLYIIGGKKAVLK